MYIATNNQRYPCRDYSPGQDTVRYYLSGDVPEELGEVIDLCTEDGFVMVTQTVEDFLRWEVSGNTLVLTNLPVPEPVPVEPGPSPKPGPTAQDDTDAMLVDHEYRLTVLELGL